MKKKLIATLVAAMVCLSMVIVATADPSVQGSLVSADGKVTLTPVDESSVPAVTGVDLTGFKYLTGVFSFTNAAPGETVTFIVNNLTSDMIPYFLVYANGSWQLIKATVNGNQISAVLPEGGLVAVVYQLANGSVVDQSGKPITSGSVTSPKTGEATTLPAAVFAAALVSLGLFAAKKSKAEC